MTYTNNGKKIAVVGLGLIGASLAMSLKRAGYCVCGCSHRHETESYALKLGIIDEIRRVEELRGVDCVIVCTPLNIVESTVKEVYSVVGDSAVITDVGSVKGMLKGICGRIVGGHPMAGNEHSGIHAAQADLFRGATYCVVPYDNSRIEDVEFVKNIALAVNAKPVTLSAEEHDSLAADYSHLPHLCAYALSLSAISDKVCIAGGGFTDSTRIACSNPNFWTEVFRLNRSNTLRALNGYTDTLEKMKTFLEKGDYDALCGLLTEAQVKRKALGDDLT